MKRTLSLAFFAAMALAGAAHAATPAAAASVPTAAGAKKPLKCAKGEYKATITKLVKVDAPGFVGFDFKGTRGHGGMALPAAEFNKKGLAVGAEFCMQDEFSGD